MKFRLSFIAPLLLGLAAGSSYSQQPAFRWVNKLPESRTPALKHGIFFSPANQADIGYYIYLPPGYDAEQNAAQRYPVVYYLHGGRPGGEHKSVSLTPAIDGAMKAGRVPPMIYVFVNGGEVSHYDFSAKKSFGETAFVKELIPHIDATYRTVASREGRGIEGFSQGGRGAARLAFKYPELFCSAAPMGGGHQHEKHAAENEGRETSGVQFEPGNNSYDLAEKYAARREQFPLSVLVVVGKQDFNYEANLDWMRHLESLRVPFTKRIAGDAKHSAKEVYGVLGDEAMLFHAANFAAAQRAAKKAGPSAADAAGKPGQPNIILIMADDLGMEGLGCYGGTSYRTPNLDRLAASGLRFTHAYSQPLCTPTRVELMTGKYNHRNWLYFGILDPQEKTIGHLMRSAGYRTCIAGKWQLQSYDPPDFPGAEKRRGTGMHPKNSGFESHSLFHALHTEDKGSRYANPTFLRHGELHRELDGKYGEDLNVEFIADFMKQHRNEPMFVYYPMALPHWPMVPTPRSDAWSDPARRLEEDVRYFPDMVAYMDEVVGRLVQSVTDLGLREKTLILFYCDNGTDRRITSGFKGGEAQGGKALTTQNGIRVPLIASWPGVVKAGTCSDLVDPTDFLPTLAELAHCEVPTNWEVEGLSFAGALRGNEQRARREACFFWYDPRPGWDKERYSRAIFALDHDYKLFSDGRLFKISGEAFAEALVDPANGDANATAARNKLQKVIHAKMQPPMSKAALTDPLKFGKP